MDTYIQNVITHVNKLSKVTLFFFSNNVYLHEVVVFVIIIVVSKLLLFLLQLGELLIEKKPNIIWFCFCFCRWIELKFNEFVLFSYSVVVGVSKCLVVMKTVWYRHYSYYGFLLLLLFLFATNLHTFIDTLAKALTNNNIYFSLKKNCLSFKTIWKKKIYLNLKIN